MIKKIGFFFFGLWLKKRLARKAQEMKIEEKRAKI